MTELQVDRHIEAARRELRVRAWSAPHVEAEWQELALGRENDRALRARTAKAGGIALALAAVFALVFVAWRVLMPGPNPPALRATADESHFERLALGDGTEVRFEPGTRLDVRERSEARVVVTLGKGAARFRVRHDPHRLFRVEAGGVEVEDLGTAFEVENTGSSVRVSVSEGSVAVSFPHGGEGKRKQTTLGAGQSGVFASGEPRSGRTEVARPAVEEPAAAASSAPRVGSAPPPASNWRELARAGKHKRAYELVAPGGFRDVRNEPGDLLLASDVARLSQHPADAALLLKRLLSSHSRDPRAPSAAFTLGWVLMNELGRPREAALAFARAEALAPRGNLAEDAVARSIEAWYRAGEIARANAEVDRYRKRYPQGRHLAMLDRLVGKP